jgi:hypothetical protein
VTGVLRRVVVREPFASNHRDRACTHAATANNFQHPMLETVRADLVDFATWVSPATELTRCLPRILNNGFVLGSLTVATPNKMMARDSNAPA